MATTPNEPLFASRPPERAPFNPVPWVIAGVVVLVLVVGLVLVDHRKPASPNAILPLDPQASSLVLSGVAMSEATSIGGAKATYIDGRVKNAGTKKITSATVQVLFPNSEGMPPQLQTLPLALIRTRQPYVDTQPITDAPLAPGDEKEFRLIFEDIHANWNQQVPEIHVVRIGTR